jgi:predicted metal-dependent peptidase
MIPMTKESTAAAVNNVVKAIHQAKLAGAKPGSLPGGIEQIVEKFLKPIIPWEAELKAFFNDLLDEDFTWRRPNRRHSWDDMYLPSRYQEDGRLEHLIYYLDVSGSITDQEVLRFNSEVKFIKEHFNPKKLTLVQFDTIIQKEDVFHEDDRFEKIVVVGRGGTCLKCVHAHIVEHKPTAAVIFSDLCVAPMKSLPFDVPIIWACTQKGQSVPFGKLIYVRS